MHEEIEKIKGSLDSSGIMGSEIRVNCTLGNINFQLFNKDIMGNIIQEWFYKYIDELSIVWKPPINTQSYPDIILSNDHFLEVKCFNRGPGGSVAFDLANFKAFIDDMIINPKRLNSDYIIFGYSFSDEPKKILLEKYWIKKIWEITSIPSVEGSQTYGLITSQVKKGNIVNLRPFKFENNEGKSLKNKVNFINQVKKTISHFKTQLIKNDTPYTSPEDWHKKVLVKFREQTGENLFYSDNCC